MATDQSPRGQGIYAEAWDGYVESWPELNKLLGGKLEWVGDEWGSADGWGAVYRELFIPAGVSAWQRAVEIGQGSGKYTLKVLTGSEATVRAYDVSPKFLQVCEQR